MNILKKNIFYQKHVNNINLKDKPVTTIIKN